MSNKADGRRKLSPDWTPSRMLALWETGASYAQIARMTGAHVTRHAIVYHVRRAQRGRQTQQQPVA